MDRIIDIIALLIGFILGRYSFIGYREAAKDFKQLISKPRASVISPDKIQREKLDL